MINQFKSEEDIYNFSNKICTSFTVNYIMMYYFIIDRKENKILLYG